MDDDPKMELISHLKNEINLRDKDIHQAATYGKQLFEEKAALLLRFEELNSLKEVLEQEKHSLQLDLETCNQTINSLTNEAEFQRDFADDLAQKLKVSEKENGAMHKKIQNLMKENQYYKNGHEEFNIENTSLKDKISLLEKQIKNFQEQAEKSLCEAEKEDKPDLQAQLNTYMLNNEELQDTLSEAQCQLEAAKINENHLKQIITDLEEAVSDRDAEIRANSAEIKKAKDEIEELQAEVEILKFDQVDTKRRGNSMFAELDDRRTIVEKEYKKLQKKFEQFHKNYESNKSELDIARGQIAILQSVASRDYQQSYIDKLEELLSLAKNETQDLYNELSNLIKCIEEKNKDKVLSKEGGYEYLRIMLKKSQEKEKELRSENLSLRNRNMVSNNKVIESQQHHYKLNQELDSAQQEIAKLKLMILDLEQGVSPNPVIKDSEKKQNVDVFEGYQPKSECEKLNKSIYNPNSTIIPGELELNDDGFQPAKQPRKSNKFILQEFNRADDKVEDVSINPSKEKGVSDINVLKENESVRPKQRNRLKGASNKKNDNCAQQ